MIYTDSMGLSSEDAQNIVHTINNAVDRMTEKGERFPDPDKNNRCRTFPTFWGIIYDCGDEPEKLKDCGEQTETVLVELSKIKYDDTWICEMDGGIGHAWGFCVSKNLNDPSIWFDPRSGQIQENSPCPTCQPWFGDPQLGQNYIEGLRNLTWRA